MSRSYPSDEGSGALLARVASAHKVYHHTYLRSHRKVEIIAKFSVMIIEGEEKKSLQTFSVILQK